VMANLGTRPRETARLVELAWSLPDVSG